LLLAENRLLPIPPDVNREREVSGINITTFWRTDSEILKLNGVCYLVYFREKSERKGLYFLLEKSRIVSGSMFLSDVIEY